MILTALPDDNGGADLSLVILAKDGKPSCIRHGAMNKVSADGIWRCITTTGANGRRCDAGAFCPVVAKPHGTCLCNVGVQACPRHPGNLKTKEEKIAFRKAWDAAVDAGR